MRTTGIIVPKEKHKAIHSVDPTTPFVPESESAVPDEAGPLPVVGHKWAVYLLPSRPSPFYPPERSRVLEVHHLSRSIMGAALRTTGICSTRPLTRAVCKEKGEKRREDPMTLVVVQSVLHGPHSPVR